jgi:hypothetical protein
MKPIYHGSNMMGLETIKPFKRFTPGGEVIADTIPPRIYATCNPAYAVAHSFPWSSDDGIDITIADDVVIIVVPQHKQQVLKQSVCIYTLPDDSFTFTKEEETGLTHHSTIEVKPTSCEFFSTVTEAIERFGGQIKLV